MESSSDLKSQNSGIELIQKLAAARAEDADKIALWQDIEQEFGGRKEFVREMKMLYDSCARGSANKVRMGSLFLEIYAQAAVLTPVRKPETEMSLEELAAALNAASKHGIGTGQSVEP